MSRTISRNFAPLSYHVEQEKKPAEGFGDVNGAARE